ncbi:MAG: bifunctional 4-hydroxy-2-oxoglutarate aldolase/2-dehydro-3-deoxy-phosphogluconate aldolase [Promethearchaeota archaeon]
MNTSIIQKLEHFKIIPVATIENADTALKLGKTLLDANLPVIEVTFRTAAGAEAIFLLTKEFPDLLVGAGTVLKVEQIKRAINAGAQFIVTPGFNPTVVDYCIQNNITIIPGLNTPSMIEWALERGINLVKFFPANLSGGPKMLQALSGPYPMMRFIPTGGINDTNLEEYLKLKNVSAVGGSWIVQKNLISADKFEEIKKRIEKALEITKKA